MTPLTDKQLEAAAREYCRLEGCDPDGLDFGEYNRSGRPVARWRRIAIQLSERGLENIALSVGRAEFPHD